MEHQLRVLIEATTDFVGIADRQGRTLYMNRAGRKLLGLSATEDVTEQRVDDLQPAWARALVHREGVPAAVRDGAWRGETALLTRDGREIPTSQVIVAHKGPDGRVDFFATVARDIGEQKRAEERTAALLEIAKDISGTLDLDEILDRVQRRTAALLPCDRVVTYYWDPARNTFRDIARYGVPEALVADAVALEFRPDVPIIDTLARGNTVMINDATDQQWLPAHVLAHFGIGALIAVPLAVRGRILGALVAIRTDAERPFAAVQVRLLESVARNVAVAIEAVELYRGQQEEAQISVALARVGTEMISSLDLPVLLDRLCQLTTEVLGCDSSHTVLWSREEDAYLAVAGYGYPVEPWHSLRLVRVPADVLAGLLSAFEQDDVYQLRTAALEDAALRRLNDALGITVALGMALRRGREMIGFHVACYRGRTDAFTAAQERIGRGIAQLASMALANALLVDELGRASRLKSDFVATMSHELRTPLNSIIGYTDLLLDGAFGPLSPNQDGPIRRVESSAKQLLELINRTLDMSRLEAGHLPVEIEAVDIERLLAEVAAETRELQEKEDLRFEWEPIAGGPYLHTDRAKLKVVLKNLIGNAAKFTERGRVTIAVRPADTHIAFEVSDTGIGIPSDVQRIIFDPFRQADSSTTRRYGGVGLGLYIARRMVEMLGGSIEVESEVGRGSTFRVHLPRAPRATLPDQGSA